MTIITSHLSEPQVLYHKKVLRQQFNALMKGQQLLALVSVEEVCSLEGISSVLTIFAFSSNF